MTEKGYTQEQMTNTKSLCDIIARFPADKQPEIIRMIEVMILGAEMALAFSAPRTS